MPSTVRALLALLFCSSVLLAAPAAAQEPPSLDAEDHARRVLALREERQSISLEGPDFAVGMGAQVIFYACIATTVGSIMEVFSQELSQRWRFDAPPWFAIGGAVAGFALASIGVPLLAVGGVVSGQRDRRIHAIDEEIAEHEAALGLTVSPTPDGVTVAVSGTF